MAKKTFAVPNTWGKNTETIKFKAVKPFTTKKKEKSATKHNGGKKAESATAKASNQAGEKTKSKIKSGRIERKKQTRTQKLTMTSALKIATNQFKTSSMVASIAESGTASKFQTKLKEQLMGGRFRFINEQLYSVDSRGARVLFEEDRDAFSAYHDGYRHQVEKWPINPLNRIAKMILRLPKSLEIGDFGCGEGKLAEMVPHHVHSMDLVSCREDIIACDMASTPLKAQSLDVAVYCLSLMNTNLNDVILEANRVLKMGGLMYIAEIQSRFAEVRRFVQSLELCGFDLLKKDASVKLFYFFQFKKIKNVDKTVLLPPFSLKPCLYRKR